MDLFAERTILSVSRLTSLLKELLEENFQQVWVEGELSNLSQPASGHLYFTLKDSGAMVRCVMFRGNAKALKFRLEEGMSLIVRGRLSVYDQRGEYQIVCEYLEPRGAGALQVAFVQLKERLSKEGLFDEARKRQLPVLPRRVGIVTSSTGAAIHDILNVLGRRFAALELLIYPVRVQGHGAAQEIAQAIDDLNRMKAADVLIVGRGGGSLEDLWAFNEEAVARAVYRSSIPVISAVGHETDWTIADFTADLRAPTPSAAAELVCASSEELSRQVSDLSHRLRQSILGHLHLATRNLQGLSRALHDPSLLLGHLGQRLDDLSQRLDMGVRHNVRLCREQSDRLEQQLAGQHPGLTISRLRQELLLLSDRAEHRVISGMERHGRTLGEATARLDTLSPLRTLSRGYAVAERVTDGSVARDAGALIAGELLRLRLHQGTALCRVENQL